MKRRGPSPVFLDTGFVIGLLNVDDPFHAAAVRWRRETATRPIVTTSAVLLECGDGFGVRRTTWPVFTVFLRDVRRDPRFEIVDVDTATFDRAVALRNRRLERAWGITDCTSFVVMRDRGITEALATDGHFEQAGFDALLLRP